MTEKKPYASAMVTFLKREDGTEKKAMLYPITRIELLDCMGAGIPKKRVFVAEGNGVWREET